MMTTDDQTPPIDDHAPELFAVGKTGQGIRCTCGDWEGRTVVGRSSRVGLGSLWTSYRRHWCRCYPLRQPPPKSPPAEQVHLFDPTAYDDGNPDVRHTNRPRSQRLYDSTDTAGEYEGSW